MSKDARSSANNKLSHFRNYRIMQEKENAWSEKHTEIFVLFRKNQL